MSRRDRILVVGATGFVGCTLMPILSTRYRLRCFLRPAGKRALLPDVPYDTVFGDLKNVASLEPALNGVDTVVYLTNLLHADTPAVVRMFCEGGIRRAVFISTTAIYTNIHPVSRRIRLEAEASISGSGLAYTILRPTMIYGGERDRNMSRLIRFVRRWPIMPVFGDGQRLQQPVYVGDVARAVVQALESERAVNNAYNLAGAAPLTYNQLIDTVAHALRTRVVKLHIPAGPAIAAASVLGKLRLPLPVNSGQLIRLNQDKAFDYQAAAADLGYQPLSFAEGIHLQLAGSNL